MQIRSRLFEPPVESVEVALHVETPAEGPLGTNLLGDPDGFPDMLAGGREILLPL